MSITEWREIMDIKIWKEEKIGPIVSWEGWKSRGIGQVFWDNYGRLWI